MRGGWDSYQLCEKLVSLIFVICCFGHTAEFSSSCLSDLNLPVREYSSRWMHH